LKNLNFTEGVLPSISHNHGRFGRCAKWKITLNLKETHLPEIHFSISMIMGRRVVEKKCCGPKMAGKHRVFVGMKMYLNW